MKIALVSSDALVTERLAEMTPQPVKIMCPKLTCRKVLSVPETARGRTVRCRGCGTAIKVPAAKPAAGQPAVDPKKP